MIPKLASLKVSPFTALSRITFLPFDRVNIAPLCPGFTSLTNCLLLLFLGLFDSKFKNQIDQIKKTNNAATAYLMIDVFLIEGCCEAISASNLSSQMALDWLYFGCSSHRFCNSVLKLSARPFSCSNCQNFLHSSAEIWLFMYLSNK